MRVLIFSKPYLLAHRAQLAAYIVVALLATGLSILSPYIIGGFLDSLVSGGGMSAVLRFCAIFGGISVLRIAKGYFTAILYVKMQAKMSWELNRDAIGHIQALSLSYIGKQDSAYLSQRVNGDSGHVIGFSVIVLQGVLSSVLSIAVPFAVLLWLNWRVTISFLVFLVAYVLVYRFFKAALYKASMALAEASNKFFQSLFEQLKYAKLIKADSRQAEINRLADKSFGAMLSATVSRQKTSYMYSSSENVVSAIAQIALFIAGGIQFINGNFTIGMFTVFTSYFSMIMASGKYFMGLGAAYQEVMVAHDRLAEIFGKRQETNGTIEIGEISEIELRGVSFSYEVEEGQHEVLKDFSRKFEKGKIYALCGENGSGKSTLAGILIGFYIDERSGGVFYDGTDIKEIDMVKARRELIGYAEQEPLLVGESLKYNLVFDSERLDEERLGKLLEMLNMGTFAEDRGLGFEIASEGANTSGGEKQKIAILKVLYKEPQLIVLDEPTSALDARAAARLMDYLRSIREWSLKYS